MKKQSLWKKMMSVALAAVLIMGVAACGNDSGSGGADSKDSSSVEESSDAGGGESGQGGQETGK